LFVLFWQWRVVVSRFPLRGYEPAEVVIVRYVSLAGGTTQYVVEMPGGAETKVWVSPADFPTQRIRDECRVEYDGETLRVLGPGAYRMSVPGFLLHKAGTTQPHTGH
jgi:hypothetical protein